MPSNDTAFSRTHIYCRVSSASQEDNTSLDSQEAACRHWCTDRKLAVASVAREVWSGADRHRPELDGLLDRLLPGDVVIVYALDRLSRSQLDTSILIDRIESAGASLALVTEDFEKSATGTFLRNAKSFVAELEREKIAERTQRGRRARVTAGKPLVSPRPPYGYQWNADKSGYVLDPVTAPVVRKIFDAYLGGATLRGVCTMLEERGILSPTGRPQWTATAIRQVITRSIYSGTGTAYATVTTRRPGGGFDRRVATPEERTMLPGIAPAIVTPEEHALAQSILERNKVNASRNNRDPEATLLRAGFIRCGHCGWTMNVNNAPPSAPGFSPAYHCNAKSKRVHNCPQPSISASVIDGPVWERVSQVLADPSIIAKEVDRRRHEGGFDRDLAALEKHLAGISQKQARTAKAIAAVDDDAAAAPLLAELKALAASKTTLEQERDVLQRRLDDERADAAKMAGVREWCQRVNANLDRLSYDEKRLALEALGVEVLCWRKDAIDARGNPLPRWEIIMRPTSGEHVVYSSTRCNTPHR
jgi:site-specific DNA recombinase